MMLCKLYSRMRFALVLAIGLFCAPTAAFAQPAQPHAGGDDFNWEIGLWDTHVQVRAPLDADAAWTTFDGASDIRALSGGRANAVELALVNAAGARIEGVSLRLFNPQTGQWSLNYASMRDGTLSAPVYGQFSDGRGVFFGQDTVEGRVVLVRFVISDVSANGARFMQSYSADGGQTWIDNWIATDTRHAGSNRRRG